MRSSPVSLSGTTLRFDRSGRRVIVIDPDEISVVDTLAPLAVRLGYRGARAAAGFDHELWIATHDHQLVRIDPTGAMLGAPVALPFAAEAVLAPAPCGPPAAVWASANPVVCSLARSAASPGARPRCLARRPVRDAAGAGVAVSRDGDAVVCAELADVDAVIPITGQRVVVARGSRLTLPSGLTVALAPTSQVVGGAVTTDGRSLTVLVARGGERELLVVALGLGQVLQRRTVPARAAVAVAGGVAAIQREPRVLQVIDLATGLASGRELGGVRFAADVAAFALDPTGRALAIRSAAGEVEIHRIDPLFPRPFSAWPAGRGRTVDHRVAAGPDPAMADAPSVAAAADAPAASTAADTAIAAADTAIAGPDQPPLPAGVADAAAACAPAARPLEPVAATTPLTAPLGPSPASPRGPGQPPDPAVSAAADDALVHHFGAPTVHATDWLYGSSDYLGVG